MLRSCVVRGAEQRPDAATDFVLPVERRAASRLQGDNASVSAHHGVMVRLRTAHLIGREDELDQLRAAGEAARAGQPGAVLVCGPAGVGKTRVVEEAVRRLCRDRDLVLVGHCVDLYGEEIPYAAAGEVLRHLVRERGARPSGICSVPRLVHCRYWLRAWRAARTTISGPRILL
jgi:hypothetical protein